MLQSTLLDNIVQNKVDDQNEHIQFTFSITTFFALNDFFMHEWKLHGVYEIK